MKIKIAVIIASALLVAGCSDNCAKACQNAHDVCLSGEGAFDVDVSSCTSYCEDNVDGCKNLDAQSSCLLAATACTDLEKCPTCLTE
jgi:hypothetical protein